MGLDLDSLDQQGKLPWEVKQEEKPVLATQAFYPQTWQEALNLLTNASQSNRHEVLAKEFYASITSLVFSPNGRYLAVALDDDSVKIIDLEHSNGRQPVNIEFQKPLKLAFTPDSKTLILANSKSSPNGKCLMDGSSKTPVWNGLDRARRFKSS